MFQVCTDLRTDGNTHRYRSTNLQGQGWRRDERLYLFIIALLCPFILRLELHNGEGFVTVASNKTATLCREIRCHRGNFRAGFQRCQYLLCRVHESRVSHMQAIAPHKNNDISRRPTQLCIQYRLCLRRLAIRVGKPPAFQQSEEAAAINSSRDNDDHGYDDGAPAHPIQKPTKSC